MQKKLEKLIWVLLGATWLSHLVGLFVPETGFDAVWYHLPVIKAVWQSKNLIYLPELYQSLNPLLSDLIFGLGWGVAGELGTKVVAYLFGLGLAASTYFLSRKFLDKTWSLLVVLIMSGFQVVAWQSASFYVDVAKAMWEVLAFIFLTKWNHDDEPKWLIIASLMFGASLATKLFSIFLLPAWLLVIWSWSYRYKVRNILVSLLVALIPPLPFYLFSFLQTGQVFYSLDIHLQKLGEIGSSSSLMTHVITRTLELPAIFSQLIFARDYTSILLVIFLPILLFRIKGMWRDEIYRGLIIFTLGQLALWWYLPPISTRYALSGFVIWLLVTMIATQNIFQKNKTYRTSIMLTIFLAVAINLVPRLVVNLRSWKYLSGQQTKAEYIQQFFDGNIDQHLKSWHQL